MEETLGVRLEEDGNPVASGSISGEDPKPPESSETTSDRDFREEATSPEELPPANSPVSIQKVPLYEGPEIIQRLNVFEEVELGGVVTFECKCKGNPVPSSKWYKDDEELANSDRFTIEDSVETDGKIRLIIKGAEKSDEGAYRCKLENQEGVAATTGYLSVTETGPSQASDEAIGAVPLTRGTEDESNSSQGFDESTPTPLEKILAGEFDLTTLPYSQYLELMKDNNSRNTDPAIGTPSEKSRNDDDTGTSKKSTENGDVTAENNPQINVVVMETNDTPKVEETEAIASGTRFENDFEMSLSTDSANSFETETPIARVATYGLNLEPVQIIHQHFGDESFEVVASDSQILQENVVSDETNEKIEEEEVDKSDEKKKLEETVIVGRIGLPSDWEFAHYTSEMDDNEEALGRQVLPGEVEDQVEAEVISERTGDKIVEEIPPLIDVESNLEAVQVPAQEIPVSHEGLLPASEGVTLNEEEEAERISVSVAQTVLRDESGGPDLPVVEEQRNELKQEMVESSLDALRHLGSELREEDGPPSAPEVPPTNDLDSELSTPSMVEFLATPEPSEVDLAGNTSWSVLRDTLADSDLPVGEEQKTELKPEVLASAVSPDEGQKILTTGEQEAPQGENSKLPVEEGKHPTEVTPEKEGDRTAVLPANEVSAAELSSAEPHLVAFGADSIIPDETRSEEIPPKLEKSAEDEKISQPAKSVDSMFTDLLPSLSPAEAAISGSPQEEVFSVSSYLPADSVQSKLEPGPSPPVRLEEIEVSMMSDQSLVDWWIEWFQFPWFFYVVLVLLSTIFASAMQANPALVILVVAVVSLIGFFLFPLQGVKGK